MNHIEYRGGFIPQRIEYNEIEKIDVYFKRKHTNNIILYKSIGICTFIGNFRNRVQLKEFLKLFESKGCQLSNNAKNPPNACVRAQIHSEKLFFFFENWLKI